VSECVGLVFYVPLGTK